MVGTPEWWRSKCNEEGVMMPYRSCKGVRDDPVPGKPPGVTKRSDLSYFERRPYSDRLAPSSRAAASPGRRIAEPAATAPAVRTARRVLKYPIAIRFAPLSQRAAARRGFVSLLRRTTATGRRIDGNDRGAMIEDRRILTICGDARESVEGLPCDPARVRDPVLVGSRVTARLLVFLDHARIGRLELRAHAAQFVSGIYLEPQMADTGGSTVG